MEISRRENCSVNGHQTIETLAEVDYRNLLRKANIYYQTGFLLKFFAPLALSLSLIWATGCAKQSEPEHWQYDVTMTTTLVVPKTNSSWDALCIWHALPTRRSWSPGTNGPGASELTVRPPTGQEHYEEGEDSHVVMWEMTRELTPGGRFSFVSRFRVESVRRHFDPASVRAQWSDFSVQDAGIHPTLKKIADRIRQKHPPAFAVLEFCRWIDRNLTYDASVSYDDDDVESILKYKKGHCGHYLTIFAALCAAAGIPERSVLGLNLYSPDGRTGGLQDVRPDFTNIHVWAEVEFPGTGWVEVEPAGGDDAYEIPACFIQNNRWFQNYDVWFEENGEWKQPDWQWTANHWVSPYQLEHIITYSAKPLPEK